LKGARDSFTRLFHFFAPNDLDRLGAKFRNAKNLACNMHGFFSRTMAVSQQWYEKLILKFPRAPMGIYVAGLAEAEGSLRTCIAPTMRDFELHSNFLRFFCFECNVMYDLFMFENSMIFNKSLLECSCTSWSSSFPSVRTGFQGYLTVRHKMNYLFDQHSLNFRIVHIF
jgi:hypothetical protein